MRTYLADIIPRIQKFSKRLDDLSKLTNYHWVSLEDIVDVKRVFMFRDNSKLLIAENGIIVDKGTWEYLGNQSLLIETSNGGYLLKHAFFDENIIALKLDSTNNYAFFVNETRYENELNTIGDILKFLENKYIKYPNSKNTNTVHQEMSSSHFTPYNIWPIRTSDSKILEVHTTLEAGYTIGDKVFFNGNPAPCGKYKLGWLDYVIVEDGKIQSF